jgi:hypothetical protein
MYSNGHVGEIESPFDSNVTIEKQLEQAYLSSLDILFVTNHNTLDGFEQLINYKNNHSKFSKIGLYPAEEVTTDKESHVLVYGLHKEIKSGQSLDEILDDVKDQDAVTIAPHPFSLIDALRESSKKCDLFEVFNSANIDVYSNKRAEIFAKENNLHVVAGSDSHVTTTIARCTNLIDSENNIDDVIYALKHKQISIEKTAYVEPKEVLEHIQFKIEHSKEHIDKYINEFYPKSKFIFNSLYKFYMITRKNYFWELVYHISLIGVKRISKKINFEGLDPYSFRTRDIPTITKMVF